MRLWGSTQLERLLSRLSAASVRQRCDPYVAIDWDEPAFAIDVEDPRWELSAWDPVGASPWYSAQPADRRRFAGLVRALVHFKVGIEFEAILGRGLLTFASTLPNRHPAFRYIHHELVEEAQHSMMFQEVINRSGIDVCASPADLRALGESFVDLAGDSFATFLLAALSSEEVFDHIQRKMLAEPTLHPLLRQVFRIHVAEEARHLSFARAILREQVAGLAERELRLLRYRAPFIVGHTATHVAGVQHTASTLVRQWELPSAVEATMADGPSADELRRQSTARSVALCKRLGLVDPRLATTWSTLGVE